MALEPAGIDLQAKNFTDYIKKLDAIEKKQNAVFEDVSQKTGKSFDEVRRAAAKYEKQLRSLENAQKKAALEARKLAEAERTAAASRQQAAISTANIILDVAKQVGAVVAESVRLAATFQGQQRAVENVAASYGLAATDINAAISRASQGTLSQSKVAEVALTGLQFQVATTAEQFERAAAAGAALGRARGIGAEAGITRLFEGIGKREVELLDELFISSRSVNAELERLAQQQFGGTAASLSNVQRETLFIEAALNIAEKQAAALGGAVDESALAFEQLAAESENLQLTFGEALRPGAIAVAEALTQAFRSGQQTIAIISGAAAGVTEFLQLLGLTLNPLERIQRLAQGDITALSGFNVGQFIQGIQNFDEVVNRSTTAAEEAFKRVASTIAGVSFPGDEEIVPDLDGLNDDLEEATVNIESYQNALKQAESLQLSFARAAEDSARRLSRQTAKLARNQFRDRVDLLNDQAKEFDQFQQDELESVQEAEQELNEAREKAGKERLRDQDKLHRELRQAEERFNLDRFQSQRRFDLQDKRLRAAGDVLALQELREDFSLQQQEAQENFDLQDDQRREDGKDQKDTADEQRQEKIKQLEQEFNDLQSGLDQRRTEFLASQTEEFNSLLFSQAQQRQALQESYREQQEDARINQGRQLEDLGRSFAEQEGVTIEGTTAIANQLEKIFGIDGAADNIISGFTTKTESEFSDLFENIEGIIKSAELGIEGLTRAERTASALRAGLGTGGGFGERIGGIPEFQDGGIVGGPIGAPVPAIVHGGETILPTHQQSFSMNAPVIPSQTLNVNMAGGFNITGGEAAGEAATRQAIVEMTDALEITVKRLGRQI